MLALAFLVLIGVALVADGFKFPIPRDYIYFAIVFSAAVELFNVLARRNRRKVASQPISAGELTMRRRWHSFRFELGASGNTEERLS